MHRLVTVMALAAVICSPSNANDLDENGDFPTLARVEFVIGCMKSRGDQNYDTLYGCSCVVDHLRKNFSYDDYSEAVVYRQLRSTPGERGGVFRDPDQADSTREKLLAHLDIAEKSCFIKRASAPSK